MAKDKDVDRYLESDGLDTHLGLEIGLGDVLVAVQRHHHRMADGDRVRA